MPAAECIPSDQNVPCETSSDEPEECSLDYNADKVLTLVLHMAKVLYGYGYQKETSARDRLTGLRNTINVILSSDAIMKALENK